MNKIQITAIAGLNNPQTILLGTQAPTGVVSYFSLADVTAVSANLYQGGTVADTASSGADAGVFDYNNGSGELVVDFGALSGIVAGEYQVAITITSTTYPLGYLLDRGDGYTIDLTVE